jgi:plasmid stabilization system protein ParE
LSYELSRRAEREFDRIIEYRRQVAGVRVARKLEADLLKAFELIGVNPGFGRNRPDLTSKPFRFWLRENYWIVYRLDRRSDVLVAAIIDARRDVGRLLR